MGYAGIKNGATTIVGGRYWSLLKNMHRERDRQTDTLAGEAEEREVREKMNIYDINKSHPKVGSVS